MKNCMISGGAFCGPLSFDRFSTCLAVYVLACLLSASFVRIYKMHTHFHFQNSQYETKTSYFQIDRDFDSAFFSYYLFDGRGGQPCSAWRQVLELMMVSLEIQFRCLTSFRCLEWAWYDFFVVVFLLAADKQQNEIVHVF